MKTIKLLRNLAKRFPKSLKEGFDHVGLMTGKLKEETKTIVLCLDFDEIVLKEIQKLNKNIDLIISHHPFIFGTRYQVLKKDPIKKQLCDKIDELNIPVYSMHTNFDSGIGGMNDALSEKLGLIDYQPLESCPMARGGNLPFKMEVHEFAKYAIDKLDLDYAHLINAGKKEIEKVCILGGAGSYKYINALNEGYDIFLTGDIPHHIRRDIIANHFNVLDVNHEVEKIFCYQMKKLIHEIDESIEIIIIDHEKLPELIVK